MKILVTCAKGFVGKNLCMQLNNIKDGKARCYGNKAPVMLSSSAQASLTGRFGTSEYGRSKKAGEDFFLQYGRENGVKMLVYRRLAA